MGKVVSAVGSLVKFGILVVLVGFLVLANPGKDELIEGTGKELGVSGDWSRRLAALASWGGVVVERHNYWLFSTLTVKAGSEPGRLTAVGCGGMVFGPKRMEKFRKNAETNADSLMRALEERKSALGRKVDGLTDELETRTTEVGRRIGTWLDQAKGALDRKNSAPVPPPQKAAPPTGSDKARGVSAGLPEAAGSGDLAAVRSLLAAGARE